MKTGADYARTYRGKQREKLARYEAALREIAVCGRHEEDRQIASVALDTTNTNQ